MRKRPMLFLIVSALAGGVVLTAILAQAAAPTPDDLLKQGDAQFQRKNYGQAAEAYQALLKGGARHEKWRHAAKRIIICQLRLGRFDQALTAADQYVALTKNTPYEARAERLAGNLWMRIPHWGTRSGGVFHRARWMQGIRLESYRYDKKRAVAHMERARKLYADYDGNDQALATLPKEQRENWHNERIECIFELAGIYARFGIYESGYSFWYRFWGQRDEFRAETAGQDDFDEQQPYWQLTRKRPIGLRIGPDGSPIFPKRPGKYSDNLSDDEKILFLLADARKLDTTAERRYTAQSYYRQAMLARTRFGMDRLNRYAGYYAVGPDRPLQKELQNFNPWELKDGEALVLAGGRIRKVALPKQWDVLGLLRVVVGDYAKAPIAPEAQYAVGLYHQSRQQYRTALAEYARLKQMFPKSPWSNNADGQIGKIKAPQVRISGSQLQLPGEAARIQLSYRNVSKVWFTARRIDAEGFLTALRNEKIDPSRGPRRFWALQNWHYQFVNGRPHDKWMRNRVGKHLGPELARWSAPVKDDGTHRYAQANLPARLVERGTYLLCAYTAEPPADEAKKAGVDALNLGRSRAVLALSDLALVEKQAKQGPLFWICDARTGAPVPGAKISVYEVWNTWNDKKRKSEWHRRTHHLTTNGEGLALLPRPKGPRGQLHVLVKAGADRLAWSGMSYWGGYHPSQITQGQLAYCITDRPVYRPAQTVRMKIWVRQIRQGELVNPAGRNVGVTIYDPRGNKVHEFSKRTDEFGGIADQFTLGEEPALGVYRIQVHGYSAGGQQFRVEEYKKPEFEVTVEPGKTHAKLGEKLTARIKATYYFGAPVTEATVSYKVFREEYTHRYYFPGRWDWLYGPGYGWAWYDYPWMPWWGRIRCCWLPPDWWWGWYGGPPPTPVRELVRQGQAPIGRDGTVKVEIDTAPALRDHPDRDHRYVIQAEVRDASRRVISGQGAVKVTRQAYYAFVQPDRGYYRPGEEMIIRVRCLSPDNRPIETEGLIAVSSVVFGGPDNAKIRETPVKQWKASTDKSGNLQFKLRYEKSGQLKIKFSAPDEWGGQVEGYGLVWVCGRDFDGKLYRFNNLEIITDKRTYQPGQTAHVMINTKHPDSYVLFSSEVDSNHLLSWRLLHLPNKHTVIDVPVKKTHRPNFFIEATTVADARVHQQAAQICVPPEQGVMDVTVGYDKPEYKPGEQARVTVTAKGPDGKPVRAQVALSVFDKSVLYIQNEYTPPIAKFFHGRLRYHYVQMRTNLLEQFSAWGYVARPFQDLQPYPTSWFGIWQRIIGDWRTVADRELAQLERKDGARKRESGGAMAAAEAPSGAMRKAARGLAGGFAADAAAKTPQKGAPGGGGTLVEPAVRKQFADTALWLAALTTDENGQAVAEFKMPENLTTWKLNAWGMTKGSRVGQADSSAITSKNLLVRLQAPRFFLEYDEVVISANVHNYLGKPKTARVSLEVPAKLLKMMGKTPATTEVKVEAGGEARVDWRVKVLGEGSAAITVKALTDEESDAMQMTFPVLVHGMVKQVATTGSIRPDEKKKTLTVELDVPQKRRAELTRLEVQFAPSLVGAMMDALPYCLDYPYGCTEQTVSRFLPAVLTLKTLQNMGIKLRDVKKIRGRLAEIRRVEKGRHVSFYAHSPIFDEAKMNDIIAKGLARIANMQHSDGGWGWWTNDSSSPYLSSYVLYALCTAQQCDLRIDENMIRRGMKYLKRWQEQDMRRKPWSPHARHAFAAYVLSLKKIKAAFKPAKGDDRPGDLIERLWRGRDKLGLYGKALLALAMANLDDAKRADVVLQNIMQFKRENAETQVAWFRTPQRGWWYWWNSDIETNATVLRAIVRLRPKSEVAPRLVKWLLNNRRNGYYWRSTRDTTLCVAAMSDFVVASGEGRPDYSLTLDLDNGAVVKTVKINQDNFFTYDNRFVVSGVTLGGGKHTLRITKQGPGALYFNTYLRYFTKQEHIPAAGHELKVRRAYHKLVQIPYEMQVEGSEGQKLTEKRLRYKRVPVKDGDTVNSGDVIQVELKVAGDNDYTYLCLEDAKPAGCEPVQIRSGGKGQEGFYSYMEVRDEKTVFFVNTLAQGEHLLRYRLRAEVPGVFHALPTKLYAMYVPELAANGDEQIIKITD